MYDPGIYFDEGVDADGIVRPAYRGVLDAVKGDPSGALAKARALVHEHEIQFGKGEAKQDFVLDPILGSSKPKSGQTSSSGSLNAPARSTRCLPMSMASGASFPKG